MSRDINALAHYLAEHSGDLKDETLRLRDAAYLRLADALRNVPLEPGTPLPENVLSKMLGISRTPVREALHQLAAEGLIQLMNGRAVTAAERSAQELFDALRVRELVEPEAVRLAAENISPEQAERLRVVTDAMEAAAASSDRAAWSRLDREWHEILSSACPNHLLGQMVLQARNRMYLKGSDERVKEQYLIDGTQEHRLIVDAVLAGDGESASRLMREHLESARAHMFRRLLRQ
jgi:DNA-binding GntR family transcriptional regulator